MKVGDKIEIHSDKGGCSLEVLAIITKNEEKFAVASTPGEADESAIHVLKIFSQEGREVLEETHDKEIIDYVLKIISNKVKDIANNVTQEDTGEYTPQSSISSTPITLDNMEFAIDAMKQLVGYPEDK